MLRFVWAGTRSGRLHGSARLEETPGFGTGTVYQMERIDVDAALAAFDAVVAEPGSFCIETRDGTRIDFLFGPSGLLGALNRLLGRPVDRVALDLWYEEDEDPPRVDFLVVSLPKARSVVEHVFAEVPDGELWRRLEIPRAG